MLFVGKGTGERLPDILLTPLYTKNTEIEKSLPLLSNANTDL